MATVPPIDEKSLVAAVRELLASPDAVVRDWRAEPVEYTNFSSGSRALWRLSGTADHDAASDPTDWSIVLKVFRAPAGEDDKDATEEPASYAYWLREPAAYRSHLLEGTVEGFRAARCYGIDDSAVDVVGVWLEPLSDLHAGAWPLERFGLAARHLGRFNGARLGHTRVPDEPWLADLACVQEFWVLRAETQPALEVFSDPQRWAGMVRDARVPTEPNPRQLRRLLADRTRFLQALGRLPQTLCHNDAMPLNLFAQRDEAGQEETVAIDWQLCGLAPAGCDLAMLVSSAVLFGRMPPEGLSALEDACVPGYLAGLDDADVRFDERAVRFAYAASSVLRFGAITAAWTHAVATDPDWTSGFWRQPASDLAERWAPLVGFLDRQAQRAMDWLERHAT